VTSLSGDDAFEVPISSDWLDNKEWDPLPINDSDNTTPHNQPGTTIRISSLRDGVLRHFNNIGFQDDLSKAIAEHFTMFLQRGLTITVNDATIEPVLVEVLVSDRVDGPAPYVFRQIIDDVEVSIAVGLNTSRISAVDDDHVLEFEGERSATTAGWSVFCNDRAVIIGDKSRLTGWGDGLPLYHNQFSIITGVIEFRSKDADKLPVTTTKRALDTSSNVWLESILKMKTGLRIWTSYTNSWKNHPRSDQTKYWVDAKSLSLRKSIDLIATRTNVVLDDQTFEFNPKKQKIFPVPETQTPTSRKITFSRPAEEIRTVSKALFDNYDEKPSIVGEKSFEFTLRDIKRNDETNNE